MTLGIAGTGIACIAVFKTAYSSRVNCISGLILKLRRIGTLRIQVFLAVEF